MIKLAFNELNITVYFKIILSLKKPMVQSSPLAMDPHQITNYQIFQQYTISEPIVYILQNEHSFFLKVERNLCII